MPEEEIKKKEEAVMQTEPPTEEKENEAKAQEEAATTIESLKSAFDELAGRVSVIEDVLNKVKETEETATLQDEKPEEKKEEAKMQEEKPEEKKEEEKKEAKQSKELSELKNDMKTLKAKFAKLESAGLRKTIQSSSNNEDPISREAREGLDNFNI